MIKIRDYVKLIKQILLGHSRIKPAHGDIDTTVSFDDEAVYGVGGGLTSFH